jgi:hypothetical protein
MGKEGFGSGEWIGEGVNEATPASLDDTMTTKPAPHKATASGLMPSNEDEAMTMKPAPQKTVASGQMPANNKAMTKKPARYKATASGQMPAYKDEAMTMKLAPNEAAASGQMPADKDEPLVCKIFVLLGRGESLAFFFTFDCSMFFCLHLSNNNGSNTRPLQVEECWLKRQWQQSQCVGTIPPLMTRSLPLWLMRKKRSHLRLTNQRRCPRGQDASGGLREVYQVVVNDNVLILTLI